MRQKVGKERSQEGCAPLANPRNGPSLAEKNPVFVCRAAPAPGFRDAFSTRGYGRLWYVGNDGFSWSSFASGGDAYRLGFGDLGVYPQDRGYHAFGFPLRCLQE